MAQVKFTSALRRFFPNLGPLHLEGNTVAEVIHKVDEVHPGILDYLLEEDGSLRYHVNIFLDDEMIKDKLQLSDPVQPKNEILVFQALSGG